MEDAQIKFTLKSERAVAAAWASFAPVDGTRYDVEFGGKAVHVSADSENAARRAVVALCGPFRFETIVNDGSAVCQWHCPCCLTTRTTDPTPVMYLSMSDAAGEALLTANEHAAANQSCRFAV
jgi:hypothetical protein